MSCSPTSYKTFLICCNVALLFIGVSILILAVKMYFALIVLFLINIPLVLKAVKAVIATGFFISVAGTTGICGACYESLPMILIHLVGLGIIVIMEFVLGVTLMIVKKTMENAIETANCNDLCIATLDTIVLDYALPSAGLMMTIIIVEALMIYCSIRLYFFIRDRPKAIGSPAGSSLTFQNVQLQNVVSPYSATPPMYNPQYMAHLEYVAQPSTELQYPITIPGQEGPSNPPDYSSLSQPRSYIDAIPTSNPEAANIALPELNRDGTANTNPV